MSKYPYIGKSSLSEHIFLFFGDGEAIVLNSGELNCPIHVKGVHEGVCRNITTEYLSNTFGEVKSKGQAKFIKKLCINGGIRASDFPAIEEAKAFYVSGGQVVFYMTKVEKLFLNNKRKITIPLPPAKNKNLVDINDFQCSGCEIPICPVCSKSEWWPKPGDEVLVSEKPGVTIHESHKEIFGAKDLVFIGKFKNTFGKEIAVIQNEKGACFVVISELLEKPKTPEQELRDDLAEVMQRNLTYEKIINDLIDNFNITKKVKGND